MDLERIDGPTVEQWLAQLPADKHALYDAYWRKRAELDRAMVNLNTAVDRAGHYDPARSAAQEAERGRPVQAARLYWHRVQEELAAMQPDYDRLTQEWVVWSMTQPVTYRSRRGQLWHYNPEAAPDA